MCRLLLMAMWTTLGAAWLHAAEPIKIGFIGLDNYQSVAFTQLFHSPKAEAPLAGFKVIAAYPGGSPDIEESVTSLPKWVAAMKKYGVEIVDSPEKVVKQVDAVLVMSLDGRAHLSQLKPVFQSGKPVYVGRPLSASLEDTVEIFRLARQSKTPIFSCSQHRFSPGFSGMRNHPEVGKVIGCDVYGGCPREPHHPDLIWQGIHGVETLFTIMGPGCVSVSRVETDTADVLTGVWKDGRVGTYRGIREGAPKYSATVFGDKGVSTAGVYGHGVPVKGIVPTNDKYMGYEGVAIEIAKFFRTRTPPVSAEETIEIFTFMAAADESKQQNGKQVKLAEVLERLRK